MALSGYPLYTTNLLRTFRDSFSYTPYANPRWPIKLGSKQPTIEDLKELKRTTWLEF